ncbi:MAG: winged helix DNA-binding domain-containing protein [Sideroxydans sp.]|nr:winged helix DNA-binding domain-containing protein [Sideroxydans sp.]
MNIAALRLHNQHISFPRFEKPEQVVAWLGGMQGQDYSGAKWSVGLRLANGQACFPHPHPHPNPLPAGEGTNVKDNLYISRAFDEGRIVRTWPMRGTLHFVAAEDVRWILALTSPKNISGSLRRREALELDDKTLARCREVFGKTLQGGLHKSRDEMLAALEDAGISTAGQRGYHILWNCALHGLICQASTNDKEQNFALLEEWVAPAKTKTRDEALAELARRYFTSHGPATIKDFIWWSGLSAGEARAGFEEIKAQLESVTLGKLTYWMPPDIGVPQKISGAFALPGFDEYLLGYQDRSAVLAAEHAEKICPGGNGMFASTIIIDGRVAGTWKRSIKKNSVEIVASPFSALSKAERRDFDEAAARYAAFIGLAVQFKT